MTDAGRFVSRQSLDDGLGNLAAHAAEFFAVIEDFGRWNDRTTQAVLTDPDGEYKYTDEQAYAIKACLTRWSGIRTMAYGGDVPTDFPHELMTDMAAYVGLGRAG
jgi:hypothetical protein